MMKLIAEETGYRYIEGGVCAAAGFTANGVHCGLYPDEHKLDLCLVSSDRICSTAAVYTTNKVKGAPILVTKKHLKSTGNKARAIIANSRNANTCNADGEEKAERMCELAAQQLGIPAQEVLVASTGVIGQPLPIEPIESHIGQLVSGLSAQNHDKAENAIMTTDRVPKEVAVEFMLDGVKCRLGGMAKGSGMIHPDMATTLNFITTDADVSPEMLAQALGEVVKVTYNCLSIDGDTSTNDMVCVLSNGAAGNPVLADRGESYETLKKALYLVMVNLTRMLAADGEGAGRLLECSCSGAPDWETAITVAKSVIRSPLVKCAMFGGDANWGRILCALGYSGADVDVHKVDVEFASQKGTVEVCRGGVGVPFSEEKASGILSEDEIQIRINLNGGDRTAKAWGCDLTYDYVRINGDYRS